MNDSEKRIRGAKYTKESDKSVPTYTKVIQILEYSFIYAMWKQTKSVA